MDKTNISDNKRKTEKENWFAAFLLCVENIVIKI